jgi:hypothetical protein
VETNGTSKRRHEGKNANRPQFIWNVYLRDGVVAPPEGTFPDFYEAFTQLHLGQLSVSIKCKSRDQRDGVINSKTDNITWDIHSSFPRVDEDLVIGGIARHWREFEYLFISIGATRDVD